MDIGGDGKGARRDSEEEADAEKNTPVGIDDEVMMHMFHAYAAYCPPFQREATKLLEKQSTPEKEKKEVPQPPSVAIEGDDHRPSFAHLPPQSRPEVIREVEALLQRIVEDRNSTKSTAALPFSARKFKNVEITARLIASYVSVFYKHAFLEKSREVFWTVFEKYGVGRSFRAYVEALERCSHSKKRDRPVALKFADEVWIKWREAEEMLSDKKSSDARLIERAHVAMIRVLTL